MAILDDMNKYIDKNLVLSSEFGEFAKMYLMTTENISDYLSNFDLNNKNILTVCGSGDQLLNAYALGAKDVTCFDLNNLARTILLLKIYFIRNLSFDDYINFFIQWNNELFLNKETYNKLRNCLPNDLKDFFDYVFSQKYSRFFYSFVTDRNRMSRLNKYLNYYYYDKLKEILKDKEPIFIQSSITDLPSKLDSKYDVMLFSNISDSIENIYGKDALIKYRDLMIEFSKYLNKSGIIQTGYIYEYKKKNKESIFEDDSLRKKQFKFTSDYELSEVELSGFKNFTVDKVITLKKIN